ncbi:MAG: thiol reductant ABC exporter subunit CydC [Methanotrichaceae archaeon]
MIREMLDQKWELIRLLEPIRPHMDLMTLAIVSEILRQISGIGVAVLGAALFASAISGMTIDNLYPYAGGMIFLGLSRGVFGYLGPYLSHIAAFRMLVSLRDEFYKVLEPLAPAKLDSKRTGDLLSTAVADIEMLELFFAHTAGPAVVAVVVPLSALVVLAIINLWLAGILLVFLFLVALLPKLAFWLGSSLGETLRAQLAIVNAQVLDSLQGMREILAFGYEEIRNHELDRNTAELVRLQAYQARNIGLQSAASVTFVSVGIVSVLLSASILVIHGELSAGYLPISVILASSVFISMMSVIEISKQLSQTFAGARRLYLLMDEQPAVMEEAIMPIEDMVIPSLEFNCVSFRYSQEDPMVLNGLSFFVRAGSTVALVGLSGAGKTTVVSLLLRYFDPESGKILLGGRDLKSYPLRGLRNHFSVVSQEIFLFNDTIRENIRLGKANASNAEVEEAAVRANIHDFIVALPNGYDTLVGERGIRLSGGERQRIAIARALLKGSHILVLDEATSSLDAETEKAIHDTISCQNSGRTTFIIAHRLSTVVDADMIMVIRDGKIVECGDHRDLLEKGGVYARLVDSQSGSI